MVDQVKVLFADDEVLVIDKPAGLMVHPDGVSRDRTLVDWILQEYPELARVGEEMRLKTGTVIKRPGIVHRLDQDTSGVMIIARTPVAFANLKKQFQNREIKKAYLALVRGNFKPDKESGVIDKPIGRSSQDFRRWSAQPGARGQQREAVTEYHVLEQVGDNALLFLVPKTGRTHQLRVHLKAIHHPIVGDSLYNSKDRADGLIDRQALHARAITWRNQSGQWRQITAPLPADMVSALEKAGFSYRSDQG